MERKELMLLLCSAIGALVFLSIVNPSVNYQLAAFRFSLRVLPGLGYTRLELPPIGSVEAKTHLSPWNLVFSLQSIDLNQLQQLLNTPNSKDILITTLLAIKWPVFSQFVLKTIVIAALGGTWGSSWISRTKHDFIRGSITGILLVLLIMIITVVSYEPQAFTNSSYTGALRGAPWALGMAQNAWHNWDAFGSNVRLLVQNLRQVVAKPTSQLPLDELDHDFKILHVSDLHNNPLAIDVILEICDNFTPDIIIDTGDLTEFGTPLEETFLNHLSLIKTPYYLVLGNHDSPAVAERVTKIPGLILLDGSQKVDNIHFVGFRDPASFTGDIAPASSQQVLDQVDIIKNQLQSEHENDPPFLLAVHNPDVAYSFAGQIPVILSGHTHVNCVERKDGSLLINAGTTGGAGLRGLFGEQEVPLTAALIYINTTGENPILDAIDMISLYPRENRFELSRIANP